MKKLLTVLLAVCLLTLCACTPSTEVTNSPSGNPTTEIPSVGTTEGTTAGTTEGVTEGTTESATPDPTPAPEESDKLVIEDFEKGEPSDLVASLDWSDKGYGIENPILSIISDGTDIGKGYKVELLGASWCQNLTLKGDKVSAAYAKGEKYLRMWISNPTSGTVGIGITIYNNDSVLASYGVTKAVITGANGTASKLEVGDPSDMGQGTASAIIVPSGFQGWIAFDTTELIPHWGNPVLSDTTAVNRIVIDVRPNGFSAEEFYVLDEICLARSASGNARTWDDPNKGEEEELPKDVHILNGFNNAINTTPEFHEMPDFAPTGQFAGIKAGWFEGMTKNGKKTKVFAYVGFPKDASASSKVPAIVLNHGGGGHAFLQWVKMWNDRGYAAIAIDNTGYFPTKVNAGSTETNGDWRFGIPRDLKEDGFVNAPNNDGMGSSKGKVENMWMYHAVGQTILASNILRADERVDGSKVGVTGISWGGVITSITIGYDTRFAFAIPIYGSGYLDEALSWMKDNFAGAETRELWLAQDNFDKVDMPVLWLCWNDDNCFSINSNSKSYLDTIKNNPDTRLSMINKMYHSHGSGWAPGESMLFADSIVKGGTKLTDFKSQPTGKSINAELIMASGVTVTATLYYITEDMTYSTYDKNGWNSPSTYMDQTWQTKALSVENGKVVGEIPSDAKGYYVELKTTIDGKQYVTCSAWTTDVK
ncbi:MAG: hypothetical protein IKK58_06010 [Clostridia bacterium]|nr:hypothetical protein [Clostridia bacterium]